MNFIYRSFLIAVMATPSIIADKFFYEAKTEVKASIAAFVIFVLGSVMLTADISFATSLLLVLVFLPIAINLPSAAGKLSGLHSMLSFMRLTRDFSGEHMSSEVLKITFAQVPGYMVLIAIIGTVVFLVYGVDHVSLMHSDFEGFIEAESALLKSGLLSASLISVILFVLLNPIVDAVYAVPTAAAAYGLDPRKRSYNGIWGTGFRAGIIFITMLTWNLLFICFAFLAIDMATVGSLFERVQQVNLTNLIGTFSDPSESFFEWHDPRPISSVVAFALLFVFQFVLRSNLLAACSGMAFRERLALEEQHEADAAPTFAEKLVEQQQHTHAIENLRQRRMPPSEGGVALHGTLVGEDVQDAESTPDSDAGLAEQQQNTRDIQNLRQKRMPPDHKRKL